MMFRSRAAQTTILATGSALAFMAAAVGDHAQAQGNLDASYTISFARIPVGEITATVVFGDSEYAVSARARAGGCERHLHFAAFGKILTGRDPRGQYSGCGGQYALRLRAAR
jgi:hypothetical protein